MSVKLSVVIPVFNEEENLRPLAQELSAALRPLGLEYEVLWVDDGSADSSPAIIRELCAADPAMRGIFFGRNFGQTAAIAAGARHSRGELVALLDADGQNDPADIPSMLEQMQKGGYDLVSGWRKNRQDARLTRILPSALANWIISRVTGVPLHDYGCTLKIYRSEYLRNLRLYGEMHRFIPAFAASMGARITEHETHHRPRTRGSSKYGLGRTFKVLLDLMTVKFMGSYLSKPIYFFGGWAAALCGLSGLLAAYTAYNKFFHHIFVKDQPLFLVAIFMFIIGALMLMLGLLSEVLIRVYYELNDGAPYHIRSRCGGKE
ncbi:MAG: glycosyltransferase family 2 protein [Elusimicrobia bacterium]|nr:glycosyltransferase family 2 protein [Elusimicrobiota bacterium]